MALHLGRRVPTPFLHAQSQPREEVLEDMSSLKQDLQKLRCKQPLRLRAGIENVAPEVSSAKLPSPGKLNLSSPNKENEETPKPTLAKRKLFDEVSEEQILVEALRHAPEGQCFAALCGLRKALAGLRPPIQGVLRCGGAEVLVGALRSVGNAAAQTEAAWCLVQLASGSTAQTKQLVQAGACKAALEVLQSSSTAASSELCGFLLQLLANVAGDAEPAFRDGLLDADIVNILGQLFAEMPDFTWTHLERCDVLRSFTWLMASLCRGTPSPQLEKVDCAFDFFAQVLQGTADTEMLSSDSERCQRAARMLSSGESEAPVPHPLLQQVVRCIRTPGDWRCPLPNAALRLAGILVQLPEAHFADALLEVGLLGVLHATLVDDYAPTQVRREAAWTLGNLAAGNLAQAERLAEQPGLVEALCDQRTTEVAVESSWTILNLLQHGPQMFLRLGVHRVLSVLLHALDADAATADSSLQRSAMEQLELLIKELQTPEVRGLVGKLQALAKSPDDAILHKARFLLQNFCPAESSV